MNYVLQAHKKKLGKFFEQWKNNFLFHNVILLSNNERNWIKISV